MNTIGPFRDAATGRWIRIRIEESRIRAVELCEEPSGSDPLWISPGFWDIQTNGRWGISFASGSITEQDVRKIAIEHAKSGVTKLFPTLITAPHDSLLHGVRTIASACEKWPVVAALVGGIHLEGPWISPEDGYRGAHPITAVRFPDRDEFRRLQEASCDRITLVTLAPEIPETIPMIEHLTKAGVTVAVGHSAANGSTLQVATAAGARLSTHLGNGIASPLPRHPNPIWQQAAEDRLMASFISDGKHLDDDVLRVLARAKGPERTILVSDLSPLAGLPAGLHGEWEVTEEGKIVVAGTNYLAGSQTELDEALSRFLRVVGWDLDQVIATVTTNPARLLGRAIPVIATGASADLTIFTWREKDGLEVRQTFVAGENMEGVFSADFSHPG